jgi:rubrerythrin
VIAAMVVGLLVLGGIVFVAAPLRIPAVSDAGSDGLVGEALARKKSALDALIEIEEERTIGKLSTEDYAALKKEYEFEAVRALRELDTLGGSDAALEAEIAEMRERLTCPNCGALRSPGETCPRCGS